MSIEFYDTIKRLVVKAIYSCPDLQNTLVLKGGNLMDLVFNVSSRSSVDLDFSIPSDFSNTAILENSLQEALTAFLADHGYYVFDIKVREKPQHLSADMRPFWGGYQIDFKIIETSKSLTFGNDIDALRRNATVIGDRFKRKFEIDISKHEFCEGTQQSLFEGCMVRHYSAEMLVFEKLRAICQQMPPYLAVVHGPAAGRARDFIDIHQVTEEFHVNFASAENHQLVTSIFVAKRVPLELIGEVGSEGVRAFHQLDFEAVKNTMKPDVQLEDFEYYVEYLVRRCKDLEPLWNK